MALKAKGPDPAMEFAAALITVKGDKQIHEKHLSEAIAGAEEESLLARNLIVHFRARGKTLRQLRTSVNLQ
jgi:hypothetical protein